MPGRRRGLTGAVAAVGRGGAGPGEGAVLTLPAAAARGPAAGAPGARAGAGDGAAPARRRAQPRRGAPRGSRPSARASSSSGRRCRTPRPPARRRRDRRCRRAGPGVPRRRSRHGHGPDRRGRGRARLLAIRGLICTGAVILAGPSHADTPRCVTKAEFRDAPIGTRMHRAHSIFDTDVRFLDGGAGGFARRYRFCGGASRDARTSRFTIIYEARCNGANRSTLSTAGETTITGAPASGNAFRAAEAIPAEHQ